VQKQHKFLYGTHTQLVHISAQYYRKVADSW